LVPWLSGSEEHKSKPTQHSVKELQSLGISPNIIVCRVDHPLEQSIKDKISLFCNVKKDCVIENDTLDCLYEAPLMLHQYGLDDVVCRELGLENRPPKIEEWEKMVDTIKSLKKTTKIAIVGKYVALHDAYLSVREALYHGGYANNAHVDIEWVDSEEITKDNVKEKLGMCDGILVPGGFGDRGVEGKIIACQYARENDIPYLGICLGMQVAAIEFARNVCGLEDANSREFNSTGKNCVIDLMEEQMAVLRKGGTMRLGAYPCAVRKDTKLFEAYKSDNISERHRHRFEFNNQYRELMTEKGLTISSTSPNDEVVEAVEVSSNKFHVGVQFHPEFKSRPNKPHPLFAAFIKASLS
jgi:CTP synthase